MTLTPGDVFAGYSIQRLLGVGGMGEVYLAQHPRLPRPYALKVLTGSTGNDDEFHERFNREADLAGALSHPNIVGVHDRGECDGRLWIAMDYIDGTDAAQLLRAGGPPALGMVDVVEIVTAVADALDYAHANRLLHRDVKPANILLSATPPRRVLLADFGIARRADEISGLTATNMAIGTVAYAAPEQLTGQILDGRADQYALAATAYHLLTGWPPFPDSNPAVTIAKHLTAAPPRLAGQRPDLARLDPVFAVALAKDPRQRFPSCRAFAQALAGRDGMSPSVAYSAPAPHLPGQWAMVARAPARSRVAVLIPAILLMLLVAASAFATTQFLRAAPGPASTKAQWQPYVDAATNYVTAMYSYTQDSLDADLERALALSTGALHDQLAKNTEMVKSVMRAAHGSSACTIEGAGLESLAEAEGSVLVALKATITDAVGDTQPAQSYRLRLKVVPADDALKVAEMTFPDGGN